ncbi:MAG TPA: AgmX/PglI C-terminal domain-containing protein [Polyangiaceae bacterium]|nr:AgmX/PglI C-terminal domain-containing protein [Polyangiaceae bacterium]
MTRTSRMFPVRFPALGVVASLALNACGSSPPPAAASADSAEAESKAAPSQAKARLPELPPELVVHHLRGNEADLRRCFFANPSLRGAVRFAWKLDETGKVQGIHREYSTLSDPRVESCLSERVSEIRFGDLDKPSTARWTFVFRLVDPPPKSKSKSGRSASKKRKAMAGDERGLQIDPNSAGVLAPDTINNIVEAGFPLFARCYRDGVNRDSSMDGTVRLQFVVGTAGAVSEVSDRGSDLSDRQVVDCIAEGFYALRFPEPQHGTVQVLYRLGFQAG